MIYTSYSHIQQKYRKYQMLCDYQIVNASLSEELLQEAKVVFESNSKDCKTHSLQKLPQMLYEMKIQIPQTMLKQLNRYLGVFPTPKFTFKTFTHYVARATLEEELQDEIRNLFYHMDRSKTGSVDAQELMSFVRELEGGERMGEEEVNQLMKEMDCIKVGYLNYEDFVFLLLPK